MPGCAENIVKTLVFMEFQVLKECEFWASLGLLRVSFWKVSGDWDHFFSFLRVPERGWNLDGFSRISRGAQILRLARVGGKSVGLKLLLPTDNCRLKTEISNLRSDDC